MKKIINRKIKIKDWQIDRKHNKGIMAKYCIFFDSNT